jgi:cyanophycin synthetase
MNAFEVMSVRALRGPNVWTSTPVLEARLRGTASQAEAVAQLTLSLQAEAGARVSHARAVESEEVGVAILVVELEEEDLARRCLTIACEASRASEENQPYELAGCIADLREFADEVLLGPNTWAIAEAARRRGIPVRRLGRGSMLQLGHGFRQRRMEGARTDRTSSIGESIGWEKAVAKELLRAAGVPTPEGRIVADAEDAWRAAGELGGVVVVKPESANHGRSVFIGLSERAQITAAYEAARQEGETPAVLVERYIPGAEHRVLVVDGRVAAATRGEPLYITGDGTRTVTQLISAVNEDPRRGPEAAAPLYPVTLDEMTMAVLAEQAYTPDSVPAAGTRVLVQRNGNLSTDVTDEVHPENAALCVLAAETIGLDIAGVDLVVEDIARPIGEQGAAILEVNAMPGLMMHLAPGAGKARAVDEMIVASVFPPGEDGRIPIVAVNAGAEGAALARQIHALLCDAGVRAGVACGTSGAAADLLLHPRIEAAVVEASDCAIVAEGLGFDRCQVAVFAAAIVGSLTAAQSVLLRAVAPDGIALVPVDAPWIEEARQHCAAAVTPCPPDRFAAHAAAHAQKTALRLRSTPHSSPAVSSRTAALK